MSDNQDQFNVLRKIQNKPDSTQRELAKDLGFSLGKLNYCLRALNNKGLIKIQNLKNNKNKISYIKKYVLTPKGIEFRIKLTIEFMKRKMKEYDELKSEIEKNKFSKSIKMIEGSSVSQKTIKKIKTFIKKYSKVIVFLDSNHTYSHVKKEIELYSKLVTKNSCLVVEDSFPEFFPKKHFKKSRCWK